jgi:phosphoserine aminotransferase
MVSYNERKGANIYNAIENSRGFYTCPVVPENRSLMNIVYTLPSEELTEKFLAEAKDHKFSTLKGHRSVGGIRASMYNSFPEEGAIALGQFMADIASRNG